MVTPEFVRQIAIHQELLRELVNKGPSEDLYRRLHESDKNVQGIDCVQVLLNYIEQIQDHGKGHREWWGLVRVSDNILSIAFNTKQQRDEYYDQIYWNNLLDRRKVHLREVDCEPLST